MSDLARLSRIRKEDGGSIPDRALNGVPRRPVFCMLFEDLADPAEPAGVYGMYPRSFIPKILPWLRCRRGELLHADGRDLPFSDGTIAAVLIDPPYSEHYARELYGTDYPRPSHLLKEALRVVRKNGRFGIVHYIVPTPPEGSVFVRAMGLSMGFRFPMRAVTIYERAQASLFALEEGPR